MLKSALVITIVSLLLRSTRAIWALLFISALATAGVLHLLTHDHIGAARALRDLSLLDVVGSAVYVAGIALFG
ncbi:hypothetical protein DA075_08380 [Methylobacterium currus]|jgi:predicted ABC-type transport system involved in lysophospholipase L1 biosynthesis ATPase subunit|uniref:Uncharacterized protein n=1 Tax=Methylobacterium currus TaxID=2051553 RepID=A0A2R4WHA9_9HYPH|nr:hypothetical protein [Methylobacterium currus]AWB20924.1 hypothetical protein DA075_08380 [Methylobacterium currus]UHC14236.1 hypothetical protein LRS73_16845 [Methylobacterium currus]